MTARAEPLQLGLGLAPHLAECQRCGAPFEIDCRVRGRRPGFCSDECRRDQAHDQMRAWRRQHGGEERGDTVPCLHCGTAFAPERHEAGRLRRLCSDACRRARKQRRKATRHAA